MGQPPLWEPYFNPSGTRARGAAWRGAFTLGVHRPLTHPVVGLLGVAGEAYGTVDPGVRPGARLLATSRVLGLSAGVDWDGRTQAPDGVFSFQTAVRRGGLLGRGSMVRVDWLPGRGDGVNLGLHVPFGQPHAGRTRPLDTDVEPPAPRQMPLALAQLPKEVEFALAKVTQSAAMLLSYTNLYPEKTGQMNYGPSYASATQAYATGLAEAFRIAARNALLGDSIARVARAGLLTHVIIPYDSLFGQVKQDEKTIRALTSNSQAQFVTWLRDSSRVNPGAHAAIAAVHARWLRIIEQTHRSLLAQWRDSRLVWLPVQLALTEEEYDEQAEVDALVERVVGRPFTDQNALTYLRSSDIPLEIARSIFATRDYHVLWTHDFAGQRDETKALDEISYSMVADAYLPALTAAVQRYDSTRVMPAYFIMLDQFFYAKRNGRLWLDILENPLTASMKLPGRNAAREAHLRSRQQELWAAVRRSWRLQQDATANGGDRWLNDVVRVHTNVLLPSDFSFRSHRIVPPWTFVPDNIMRDHRKIVFYDMTAADPYRGAMIVMGVGIGEHYATPTWEDRAYRVRGPAALETLAGARRALLGNGFSGADIPFPFHAAKSLPRSDSTRQYVGRALQVHNEPGFGEKESSVARAMMYNLAPPGSVIIVPDPIWVSDTWAAMLAGASARGCRVFIISPAKQNNPNPQAPLEAIQYDVMRRLLASRDRMREQMRQTGGELRVALYNARAPVTDIAGRVAEVRQGLRRAAWIRELFPFDDATLAVLDRALAATASDGTDASSLARDERPRAPQLHTKSQLIARPGAIAALLRQPGWEDVLASAMETQSRESARFADQLGYTTPDVDSSAIRRTDTLLRGYERALSEAEREAFSFYFSLGSQNQDPRGIMLDGEVTLIVSGLSAASGVVDLYYLMARSTWIDSQRELDALLPRPKTRARLIGRLIRYAL
jgi:hypothetical protein